MFTLFMRCSIFDHTDILLNKQMLDDEGARKVERSLKELLDVFYEPKIISKEDQIKHDDAMIDYLRILSQDSKFIRFIDERHKQ